MTTPTPAVRRVLLDAARIMSRPSVEVPFAAAVFLIDVLAGDDHRLFNDADDAMRDALGGRMSRASKAEVVAALRAAAGEE